MGRLARPVRHSIPTLAEDAAQEAALRALLTLDRLRQAEQFGPWLAGIGVNVCRMWLRSCSRERWSWDALSGIVEHRDGIDGSADREDIAARIVRVASEARVEDSPETQAEMADLALSVRRAVALLPPGQRAAIIAELADAPIRYICAFCGKTNDQARRMVTEAGGSAICNACVARCAMIFAREDTLPISAMSRERA